MSMLTLRVVPIGPMSDRAVPRIGPLTRGLPLAMTLVRVPMVLGIVLAYLAGAPWTAVGLLALFIVVDILDGDVARALNAETSVRRLLDGTLDRLSVHAVCAVVSLSVEGMWPLWVFMIVRDLAQAGIGGRVLARARVVAAGAPWHRSYTLSIALWGALVMLTDTAVWPLAILVVATGIATLADYTVQTRKISAGHRDAGAGGTAYVHRR